MSDWLPEHHLSRFVVDIVEQLDLKPMEKASGTSGSDAFHPALLLSIMVYGYATGVFSNRKLVYHYIGDMLGMVSLVLLVAIFPPGELFPLFSEL